jgi:flavodoxin
MKKILFTLIVATIPFLNGLQVQAQSSKKEPKILIAYFTLPTQPRTERTDAMTSASIMIANGKQQGSTQYIASIIQEAIGGTMFEIKTIQQYANTHAEVLDFTRKEFDTKARPKLATKIENPNQYDVIFIGFPNWFADMPMAVYTFLEEYDFSGKTIVPFCTHGGSRFSQTIRTITEMQKNATILDGHCVSRDDLATAKGDVIKWLQRIGMKN